MARHPSWTARLLLLTCATAARLRERRTQPQGSVYVDDAAATRAEQFGAAVALASSGNYSYLLVGAPSRLFGPHPPAQGGALLFSSPTASLTTWTPVGPAWRIPSDAYSDAYGAAVSLSRDALYAFVSAPRYPITGVRGITYAYMRVGEGVDCVWTQVATLTAPDGTNNDEFGQSIALSEDASVVAVSAPRKDVGGFTQRGKVYVFTRAGEGVWAPPAQLVSSEGVANMQFGITLACSSMCSTLAVGATGTSTLAGAVYIFTLDGFRAYTQAAILVGSDASGGFGSSLGYAALGSVHVLSIGAAGVSDKQGVVYTYACNDSINDMCSTWMLRSSVTAGDQGHALDEFGSAVALQRVGSTLIMLASAPYATANGAAHAGRLFIYTSDDVGSSWSAAPAPLTAPSPATGDMFAAAIAPHVIATGGVQSLVLACGAYGANVPGGVASAGRVVVFPSLLSQAVSPTPTASLTATASSSASAAASASGTSTGSPSVSRSPAAMPTTSNSAAPMAFTTITWDASAVAGLVIGLTAFIAIIVCLCVCVCLALRKRAHSYERANIATDMEGADDDVAEDAAFTHAAAVAHARAALATAKRASKPAQLPADDGSASDEEQELQAVHQVQQHHAPDVDDDDDDEDEGGPEPEEKRTLSTAQRRIDTRPAVTHGIEMQAVKQLRGSAKAGTAAGSQDATTAARSADVDDNDERHV